MNPVCAGLLDELEKIAEVHLKGIKPETVMAKATRGVFESPGLLKARQVMAKMADSSTPAVYGADNADSSAKPFSEDHGYKRGRHYVRGTLSGAGVGGGLVPNLVMKRGVPYKVRLVGAGLGAAAGLADSIKSDPGKKKRANVVDPKHQLMSSSQTARTTGAPKMGKTITQQIRGSLIGRNFVL